MLIKAKIVFIRPAAWIDIYVKAQKQVCRRAERLFRKTNLTVHKEIYKHHKNKTTQIINKEKKKYVSEKLNSCKNCKQLFLIFNKLSG